VRSLRQARLATEGTMVETILGKLAGHSMFGHRARSNGWRMCRRLPVDDLRRTERRCPTPAMSGWVVNILRGLVPIASREDQARDDFYCFAREDL